MPPARARRAAGPTRRATSPIWSRASARRAGDMPVGARKPAPGGRDGVRMTGRRDRYRHDPLRRHRRHRHVGHRRGDAESRLYACRAPTSPRAMSCRGCATRASRSHIGHQADNLGDAAVVVISTAIERDNPEVEARARTPHPGDAPRRDARRADAAEVDRRGRGHARQDDDDLDGRRGARCGRGRSDRDQRRHHQQLRLERAAGRERLDGGRGRRERRQLPAARRHDRGRHQHRSRASRSLRRVRRGQGRVRRVRRERALLRRGAALPRSSRGAEHHPAACATGAS